MDPQASLEPKAESEKKERRPYHAPYLEDFGSVIDLTTSSFGGGSDGGESAFEGSDT